MGRCPDCGAPCPNCISRSDFTLLKLKEPLRSKVKKLLDDVGCKTNARTNEFIAALVQYRDKSIEQSFRIWNSGSYAFQGKDERYFLGILKHNSIATKPVLDSIPPVAEMPSELEVVNEQQDGDEIPSRSRIEPEAE